MPVGAEPRVEVEAHRGPPPVRGSERLRANPAQLLEALERALNDPGLRQPGPLLVVHLARGQRARPPMLSPAGLTRLVKTASTLAVLTATSSPAQYSFRAEPIPFAGVPVWRVMVASVHQPPIRQSAASARGAASRWARAFA
jgi:hypothetical protein